MIEHNDFTGTNIFPRASMNFKLNPNHTIRFGVSTALRTPNYIEEKFDCKVVVPTSIPNATLLDQFSADTGNLKPERIISREIGYIGSVGRFSLDTRLFHDEISDYIQTVKRDDFVPPVGYILVQGAPRTSQNGGSVKVNGFETQVKWRVTKDTRALVNYAYVRISGDESLLTRDITLSMPHNTISALLTHRLNPQWDASLAYYQTSEVAEIGDGELVGSVKRLDVRLARQFTYRTCKGEVSVAIENLFNEYYQEFAEYNVLRRRANLNVKLDF